MAQFRATIKGQRGEASRLGSKASGLKITVNGWDIGLLAYAEHQNDEDVIELYATGGSSASFSDVLLGFVKLGPNGPVLEPTD